MERIEHELFVQTILPTATMGKVQTLAWRKDALVDWAGGQRTIYLDGRSSPAAYNGVGRAFDGVVSAPDGRHVVVHQRLGTKGLLFRDGKLVRELNRSFYHAEVYEFPVGFVALTDGRTGLVHCPDEYCRLEIDDALTGERLSGGERKPADFFHSRLAPSPSGSRMLSAGWVWHPWDAVIFFDVGEALRDPRALDRVDGLPGTRHGGCVQESGAAWIDDQRVVIAGSDDPDDDDPAEPAEPSAAPRLGQHGLAVFEVATGECLSSIVLDRAAGTIMPVGDRHVVAFHREPRLVDLHTGDELHRWEGLFTGEQSSSILWNASREIPPLALDPARARFAVASAQHVTVVEIRREALDRRIVP